MHFLHVSVQGGVHSLLGLLEREHDAQRKTKATTLGPSCQRSKRYHSDHMSTIRVRRTFRMGSGVLAQKGTSSSRQFGYRIQRFTFKSIPPAIQHARHLPFEPASEADLSLNGGVMNAHAVSGLYDDLRKALTSAAIRSRRAIASSTSRCASRTRTMGSRRTQFGAPHRKRPSAWAA